MTTERETETLIQELKAGWSESEEELVEILDEAVRNMKASEASDINNAGLDAQLHFLLRVWGIDELRQFLRELTE